MNICIIDTGSANLNSVAQAVKRCGYSANVTSDLEVLSEADRLILPGVGTAGSVMEGIFSHNLLDFILNNKKPILGICLGMQILAESSTEVPLESTTDSIKTLGIVKGQVRHLKASGLRLPHMGWNQVEHTDHPLFEGIKDKAFFYFDHSFALDLGDYTIGETEYGESFTSALASGNFMGVQFHPEKSSQAGHRLLTNFINNF